MRKDQLITLLIAKQEAAAWYSHLYAVKPYPTPEEQVDHDLETQKALYASAKANDAYDQALRQYTAEQTATEGVPW